MFHCPSQTILWHEVKLNGALNAIWCIRAKIESQKIRLFQFTLFPFFNLNLYLNPKITTKKIRINLIKRKMNALYLK